MQKKEQETGTRKPVASRYGRLIGVGVGPGDPGMVTLRAVELIGNAAVLAYPVHKEGASSRAFDTVRSHVSGKTRLLPLLMPMTRDRQRLDEAHENATAALIEAAAQGNDVVYLSLGDPLFYSTFGYLAGRFPGEVEVVSGVPAMSAMAAAVGMPLASGDVPTMIVSGSDEAGLEAALAVGASIVVMKPRSLSEVSLELLERHGAFPRARAAIELGGTKERIIDGVDRDIAAALPYFSILWIPPTPETEIA